MPAIMNLFREFDCLYYVIGDEINAKRNISLGTE